MNMTPKKILSIPVYSTGTILGIIASILVLPGGFIMALAIGIYWLADKLSSDDYVECDMTLEEFEQGMKDIDEATVAPIVDAMREWNSMHEVYEDGLEKCSNCKYGDACLTDDNDYCPEWEESEYVE